MPIDPERLRRDVEVRRAARGRGVGPDGKPRTGAMTAVRQQLAEIEKLRGEGATWVDIAAALTVQGIVQGNGAPLTGRHLTALIASIRRQDAHRGATTTKRAGRADLRREPGLPPPVNGSSLALAADHGPRMPRSEVVGEPISSPESRSIPFHDPNLSQVTPSKPELHDDRSLANHVEDKIGDLFRHLDQRSRDDAETAAQRPDFSKGLLK